MKLTVKQLRKLIKEEVDNIISKKSTPSNDGIALLISQTIAFSQKSVRAIKSNNKQLARELILKARVCNNKIRTWKYDGGMADEQKDHGEEEFDSESPVYQNLMDYSFKVFDEAEKMYEDVYDEYVYS